MSEKVRVPQDPDESSALGEIVREVANELERGERCGSVTRYFFGADSPAMQSQHYTFNTARVIDSAKIKVNDKPGPEMRVTVSGPAGAGTAVVARLLRRFFGEMGLKGVHLDGMEFDQEITAGEFANRVERVIASNVRLTIATAQTARAELELA